MIRIRPAGTHDIDGLMALRTEAEQWLHAAGTDQWSDPETGGQAIAKWRQSIHNGQTWAVLDDDQALVGTVSRGPADSDFWTDADQPETALYLYKLIISRSAPRQGLGSLVIDWLSRIAALEGREWVRIDCWRTNWRLHQYYEGLGFIHVRTEAPAHRRSGWLAQRPAGMVLNPADSPLVGSAPRGPNAAGHGKIGVVKPLRTHRMWAGEERMSAGFRGIAEQMRAQIERGVYAPGTRIPTEFQLAERFGVSRETVRRALSLLKAEGLLGTARSQGTYVQHPPARLVTARYGIVADPARTRSDLGPWEAACAEQGIEGRAVVTAVEREPASPLVAARLHLDGGAGVVRQSREMWAGDQIAQLQDAWMPSASADGTPLAGAAMTAHGFSPERASEEVIARMPTSDERARLGLADGAWVLEIWRVTRDPDGRAVEVLRTVANASMSALVYEDLPIAPARRHDQMADQA